MLKIPKSVEYSLLAIKYITDNSKKGYVNAREIAENSNIPFELLAKVLQKLNKNGIVKSSQGKFGGYYLISETSKISLANVINALDQNIQITDCMFEESTKSDCARNGNCPIKEPLNSLQSKINSLFNETMLNEII